MRWHFPKWMLAPHHPHRSKMVWATELEVTFGVELKNVNQKYAKIHFNQRWFPKKQRQRLHTKLGAETSAGIFNSKFKSSECVNIGASRCTRGLFCCYENYGKHENAPRTEYWFRICLVPNKNVVRDTCAGMCRHQTTGRKKPEITWIHLPSQNDKSIYRLIRFHLAAAVACRTPPQCCRSLAMEFREYSLR